MAVKLAPGLLLPADEIATQVTAAIGMRGSGKSNIMAVIAEGLLDANIQVVILDYVGIWSSLRLQPDGKTASRFDIKILGGRNGDLPLVPGAGAVVAEALAVHRTSAVLDVSQFTKGERMRFATDLGEALFQAKKAHVGPTWLLLEEAQRFIPQVVGPDQRRMLGAYEEIAEVGRNYGLGLGLITQRPQNVNKSVLFLADNVFAHRTNGTHERKAIRDWVQEKGAQGRAEVDGELPTLKMGQALVWSAVRDIYGRHQLFKKSTYDAGATPTSARAAVRIKPLDLGVLSAAMAKVTEEAKANDPGELRAEITMLNQQVRRLTAEVDRAQEARPAKIVEKTLMPRDLDALIEGVDRHLGELAARATAYSADLQAALRKVRAQVGTRTTESVSINGVAPTKEAGRLIDADYRKPFGVHSQIGGAGLKILAALASRRPDPLSKAQVATLAGYSAGGGGFNNALSTLKTSGLIRREADVITMTPDGLAALGDRLPPAAAKGEELVNLWCGKLPGSAGKILRWVASQRAAVTKDQIADAIGMDSGGGGFNNYMSSLRSNGLLEKAIGGYRINPELAL